MPAPQNEIDMQYTAEQLTQFDAALTTLETLTATIPVLATDEKNGLVKPPENADGWMTGMLTRAEQNLARLPRDFEPASVQRDLDLAAALAPRELRLARVMDRIGSARYAARSDAFAALLGVRRTLKDSGLAGVDDNLSHGLQRFFGRTGTASAKPATPPTP